MYIISKKTKISFQLFTRNLMALKIFQVMKEFKKLGPEKLKINKSQLKI